MSKKKGGGLLGAIFGLIGLAGVIIIISAIIAGFNYWQTGYTSCEPVVDFPSFIALAPCAVEDAITVIFA